MRIPALFFVIALTAGCAAQPVVPTAPAAAATDAAPATATATDAVATTARTDAPGTADVTGKASELDSLSQERGGLPSSSYLVMTNANGQTFGCEDPLSISSSSANFFDLTYLQTVTDVAGWANAAMVTSTGYEEVAACPALGVNDVQRPALGLYPNPASDQLTLTSGTALRSIEVHAADGRLMSRQRMAGTPTLDIRALAPGAYVLRALDAQGHVLRGRFVKE